MGLITSKGGQLRLRWQGLSAGKLGLLEALEVLELGIHGQMLLWITLKNLSCSRSFEPGVNLDELIAKAETQRSQVEAKRLIAAMRTFENK